MLTLGVVQLAARDIEDAEIALEEAVAAAHRAGEQADLVVLPEATYPAYVLHRPDHPDRSNWFIRAREAFGGVARGTDSWIVVGLVRPEAESLRNSAVLFDPAGRSVAVADKSFLWHFDRRWFERGAIAPVVEVGGVPIGMLVCADARMMEIPRTLALKGARVLVDPTALVLGPSGRNAQIDYMLSVRAAENGAYVVVANKCGTEAGIARYAGRSAVWGPDGSRLTQAGPDEPEILSIEIDPSSARGPRDRGTSGYPTIVAPLSELPIAGLLSSPPPVRSWRVAVLGEDCDERAAHELDADVALGPSVGPGIVAEIAWDRARHRPLSVGGVVDVHGIGFGYVRGGPGGLPEEVRVLMLQGASVVLWETDVLPSVAVARTRADENRIFLMVVTETGAWVACAPNGAQLGEGSTKEGAGFVEFPLALAWQKEMAPGTDVVAGRAPEEYGIVAEPEGGR